MQGQRRAPKHTEYELLVIFAENVMRLRDQRGWSMNELSRRTALAPKTLRDMRDLNFTPTLSTVQKIARAFAVHPALLLWEASR